MFRRRRNYQYYTREIQRPPKRGLSKLFARRRRRRGPLGWLGEFFSWFIFLALVSGGIGGGAMYLLHTRFDGALRTHLETKFRQAYPQHRVSLAGARRIEGQGIELRGLVIAEFDAQGKPVPVVAIEEMLLQCNPAMENLLAGRLDAKQLFLRRAQISATATVDGQWNVARLFPLPKLSNQQVPVLIEHSTVHVKNGDGDSPPVQIGIQRMLATPLGTSDAPLGSAPAKAWSVDAVLTGSHFRLLQVEGTYDVAAASWQAKGEVKGLKLTTELLTCLPAQYDLGDALGEGMQLEVDGKFQASNEPSGEMPCRLAVSGRVTGRIEDDRFPLPISNLSADFTTDGHSLEIPKLSAQAGQATILGSCRIAAFHENAPCSVKLVTKNLLVDRQLVAAMPTDWRDVWGKLAPEGLVDADVELEFDGQTARHQAQVDCRDVSFAFYKFPYRVQNGQGRVTWRDGLLTFHDFLAFANGRPVKLDGEVSQPGPDYTGYVEVQVDQAVPVDEKLIAALPDPARRIVNQLHPSGAVTVQARFERHPGSPPIAKKELTLGLQGCSISYEPFPYPLSKIHGTVSMVDDRWTLKDLEGINDSAWVLCNGGWGRDEAGTMRVTLNFAATDVPLEDELRAALPPDVQQVWKSMNPRGTVDKIEAKAEWDGESRKTAVELMATKKPSASNVEGRSISVKPNWFAYQVDDVQGTIYHRHGITDLKQVRGRHGNTRVLLDGQAQCADGDWRVQLNPINIDHLEITHELTSALPRRFGESLTKLNLTGPLTMSGALAFDGRKGESAPHTTRWDVVVDMMNAGLLGGQKLDHVCGGLKLNGVFDQQGLSSHGWLDIDSLVYHGIQFTRVQGPISLDNERLGIGEWARPAAADAKPGPLSAGVFAGDMRGSGEVKLQGDFPFQLESFLFNADLATISREATMRQPQLSGRTSAQLQLAGTSKGSHTLRGTGNVQLREADVYELPVMVALLKLLKIKEPDRTAFTSSDVQYHIEGDRIYFDNIAFNGDAISLEGRGDMTLDRALNLTFYTSLVSNNVGDFLLRPLLKEAGKQLLEIKVTGTLDDPLLTPEPLRNIRENIQSIFPGTTPAARGTMSRLPQPVDPANRVTPPR